MIGEPSVQEIEMNNDIGEDTDGLDLRDPDFFIADPPTAEPSEPTVPPEPPPNALDKFMARLELPGVDGQPLTDIQKQVKGFIIYALSFTSIEGENTNPTSRVVSEIRDVFNHSSTIGNRYWLKTCAHFQQKYYRWPTTAKCIITLNGENMLLAQGSEWYRDGRILYVSHVSTRPNNSVQPLVQLLTILALGEAFGVMDSELYLAANQMLDLVKPTAGVVNSRLRNTRLAIDSTGLQIAAYHKDGYYSPNGEPVNVVVGSDAGQWTTVQL